MAVGLPLKTTYANGDVYSASDVNDTNGTINANASPYAAGKNKIINGDFNVNQRNFTSVLTDTTYGFDRFAQFTSGGTTYSTQTFTAGTAPVVGYEAKNFARLVTTAPTTYALLNQPIEDVRTFANQTATFSFWAKAGTGTPSVNVGFTQSFGSGGSANVTTFSTKKTITTSWARYSFTITVPSISGKTIGTSSALGANIYVCDSVLGSGVGNQAGTFDIWGVQVEAGSTATAFQTATGTIQGELAACQRYFIKFDNGASYSALCTGAYYSTTDSYADLQLPVAMRISPALTVSATDAITNQVAGSVRVSTVAPTIQTGSGNSTRVMLKVTTGADTAGRAVNVLVSQNRSIELSAEL